MAGFEESDQLSEMVLLELDDRADFERLLNVVTWADPEDLEAREQESEIALLVLTDGDCRFDVAKMANLEERERVSEVVLLGLDLDDLTDFEDALPVLAFFIIQLKNNKNTFKIVL